MTASSTRFNTRPTWLAMLLAGVLLVFSVCGWAQVMPGCCQEAVDQKVAKALPPCCLQQQNALTQQESSASPGLHDLPSLLPEPLDLRALLDGFQTQRNLASIRTARLADQSNRYLELRRLLN